MVNIIQNNNKRDFRKLNNNTQAELRRLAFKEYDKGKSVENLADLIEVNIQTVYDWIRKRKTIENRDFYGEIRGRKIGEKRILGGIEELKIKEIIINKTPEEVKLGQALWTRRSIQELIKQELNILLPLNTIGNHLTRWGLTPQRAGRIAKEQDVQKIEKWIKEDYPEIKKAADKENAIIKFSDETGVSLNTYYGRSYAPKGKTPNLKMTAAKNKISMISTVSIGGSFEFMLYRKGLDNSRFIKFLNKIIQNNKQKTYLILDNLITHKSKEVKKWEEKHKDKIKLFFPATLCTTIQSSRIIKQHLETQTF